MRKLILFCRRYGIEVRMDYDSLVDGQRFVFRRGRERYTYVFSMSDLRKMDEWVLIEDTLINWVHIQFQLGGIAMIGDYKEVYFHEYCKTCKHRDIEDWKDQCNPCLANPCNIDSHKPTYYEKDENVKEQK